MKAGLIKSCGCYHDEASVVNNTKHGGRRKPEFGVWMRMIERCERVLCISYRHYGGRGIKVCDRWRHDFAAFLADVGPRPSPSHSIDRIDVNGHYEPGNVRWATTVEQSRNKRNSRYITVDGQTKTLAEWGEVTGIGMKVIHNRMTMLGWSEEEAIKTPVATAAEASFVAREVRYGRLPRRDAAA